MKDSQRKSMFANLSNRKQNYSGIVYLDSQNHKLIRMGRQESKKDIAEGVAFKLKKILAVETSNNSDDFIKKLKATKTIRPQRIDSVAQIMGIAK